MEISAYIVELFPFFVGKATGAEFAEVLASFGGVLSEEFNDNLVGLIF